MGGLYPNLVFELTSHTPVPGEYEHSVSRKKRPGKAFQMDHPPKLKTFFKIRLTMLITLHCMLKIQTWNISFVKISFPGQMDFTVVQYSVTNNCLPGKNQLCLFEVTKSMLTVWEKVCAVSLHQLLYCGPNIQDKWILFLIAKV
jgi:hypothetical protein